MSRMCQCQCHEPEPPRQPSRALIAIINIIHILVVLLLLTFVIIAFICCNAGRGIEAPYALAITILLAILQFRIPLFVVNHLPFLLSLRGRAIFYQFAGALCVGTFPRRYWNRYYWVDNTMETTAFSLGCAVLGFGIILFILDLLLRCINKTHLVPDLYVAPLSNLEAGPVVLGGDDLIAPPRFSCGDWKPTKGPKTDAVPASPTDEDIAPLLVRVEEGQQHE
jgi:hypothetical protein